MEQFVIKLKDLSKRTFLLELLQQLDFVELKTLSKKSELESTETSYDFFESAGLFANREIDAKTLRKQAWDRKA